MASQARGQRRSRSAPPSESDGRKRRMPSTSTTQSAREQSLSLAGSSCGRAPSPARGRAASVRSVSAGRGFAGVAQLVERQPSKLNVASSSLVSRSVFLGRGRPNPRPSRMLGCAEAVGSVLLGRGRPNPRPSRVLGCAEAVGSVLLGRGRPNPRALRVVGSARAVGFVSLGRGRPSLRASGVARPGDLGPAAFCSAGGGPLGSLDLCCFAHLAQLVEHVLGKDEVTSSILVVGSKRLRHVAPLIGGRAFRRVSAVATLGCGNGRPRG
jgi:hypothetical protein